MSNPKTSVGEAAAEAAQPPHRACGSTLATMEQEVLRPDRALAAEVAAAHPACSRQEGAVDAEHPTERGAVQGGELHRNSGSRRPAAQGALVRPMM